MVNLFEQWNDMDFVSTYEPIDWKALNDFANRARQDAKDNADARAEKLKNLNEMYVTDVNDDFTSEANNYIKSEIERISSLGTNMAPGDFSRDLNKNMNPVLAYQKGAQKQADERRKSVTNLNLPQPGVQAIDEYNGSYDPNDGVMRSNEANPFHYLETVDPSVIDYIGKSMSDRNDNGMTSTEAYNPGHLAEDVSMIPDESDMMTGARFKSVLMLNDLGRNGEKSKYYELLKDHVVLNDDGTIKTTTKGTAILKDDFTGTGRYTPYMFKQKAKGSGFVSDEESPISFGKGMDALAREYIYGLGYNRTFGKMNKQLPRDSKSGSGKDPEFYNPMTWWDNIQDQARSNVAAFNSESGSFESLGDGSWLRAMDGGKFSASRRPSWVDSDTWSKLNDHDRAVLLATSQQDSSGVRPFVAMDRFKESCFAEFGGEQSITPATISGCGIQIQRKSDTQTQGDPDDKQSTRISNYEVTGIGVDTRIIPHGVGLFSKESLDSMGVNPTCLKFDNSTQKVSFVAGSGETRNDGVALACYLSDKIARKDPSKLTLTDRVGVNILDTHNPTGVIILNLKTTMDDVVNEVKELSKLNPDNFADEMTKMAIVCSKRLVKENTSGGKLDRVGLTRPLTRLFDLKAGTNQKFSLGDEIPMQVGVAVNKSSQWAGNDKASDAASKNSTKIEDGYSHFGDRVKVGN